MSCESCVSGGRCANLTNLPDVLLSRATDLCHMFFSLTCACQNKHSSFSRWCLEGKVYQIEVGRPILRGAWTERGYILSCHHLNKAHVWVSRIVFLVCIFWADLSQIIFKPGKGYTLNPYVLLKNGDDTSGIDSVECSTNRTSATPRFSSSSLEM